MVMPIIHIALGVIGKVSHMSWCVQAATYLHWLPERTAYVLGVKTIQKQLYS